MNTVPESGNLPSQSGLSIVAAVLAGGRSSRMGTDKALLRWKGETLIQRQLSTLREMRPAHVLVSGKPGMDYGVSDVPVVFDAVADQGPLGGFVALLKETFTPHLLVLAVDMPEMTPAFLMRLIGSRRAGTGVVPRGPNGWEPLAAVYPREVLPLFQERLNARRLSLQGAIDVAVREGLVLPFELGEADAALFRNLNDPESLRSW